MSGSAPEESLSATGSGAGDEALRTEAVRFFDCEALSLVGLADELELELELEVDNAARVMLTRQCGVD